ncbi:hypothetical protein BBJ28_00020965 [Nothophytophthora sp. Chile5]|nr:hypothetical protein BBJ28_00020965 [Nothophytophthora sp. Chile5]
MASRGAAEGAASAAGGSRCSRADCTSLREELELLRGDLLELEGENEQLHDQIAAFQSDSGAREASSAQQLRAKDEEIARLAETVAELTTQLEQQRKLQKQQDEDNRRVQQGALDNPDTATVERERECDSLRVKNEELEASLKELRAQVAREASVSMAAQRQAVQSSEESKNKKDELYTALKENEVLRGETAELQTALKKASELAREYETSLRALQDQQEAYRDAVDEQTLEITQLHTKLSQLEQEKLAVEAKLIEMDERESDVDALLGDARAKFDMEKTILSTELDELRRKLKQQQLLYEQQQQQKKEVVADESERDTSRSAVGTAVEDMERQLLLLQELRVRDKSTILELNQRVLQQQSDLESLADHLDVDTVVEGAVQSALQKQDAKYVAVERENATLKRRLKEQRDLVQDLELRQGIVEKQLVEAQEWNAKYEQQAGLEDVMKYQKKLRAQLEKEQQANIKLRHDLNEQVEASGKLHMAFERLKDETGKPDSFEYDDLAIADHLKGQLAINGAVMKQLELQIHELEAERLRLLQKLREQARMTGHKLYEQHGLTTEQWGAVEEFIDRVKHTPEVARRLLQTGCEVLGAGDNCPMNAGEDGQPQKRQQDAQREISKELETVVVENGRLLQEIERLRDELEVTQAKVLESREPGKAENNPVGMPHVLESPKPKAQGNEGEVRRLQAQIASLQKERKEWLGRTEGSPQTPPVQNQDETMISAQVDTQVHSQSRVHVKTQTEERAVRSQSTSTSRAQNKDDDDDDDVESLSTSDDDGFAIEMRQRRSSHDRGEQRVVDHPSDLAEPRQSLTGWSDHADNIALIVAKTIEAQFAMLQAQKGTGIAPASPPTASSSLLESSQEKTNSDAKIGASNPSRPASPMSRAMVDTLAFESEDEMIQQADFLRELNVCLDELVATETQNEQLQQQLRQHEEVFQALMDQHTVLYQHFFQMHAQYTDAEIHLRNELEQVKGDNKDFQLKCQRYEAGFHLLGVQNQQGATITSDTLVSGNETQLRSEVIELTRKTAVYEVNEARLKRKYQQLHDEWRGSTTHNKLLEREWSDMEKTLKYRILYLESWKQGADEMMERMEKTLDKSVMREFADKQQHVMADVLKKYGALSEAYAEMHAKYLQVYDLPSQLNRAQHELMMVRAERDARNGNGVSGAGEANSSSVDPAILQARIDQLEDELQVQTERVKKLEEAERSTLIDDDLVPSVLASPSTADGASPNECDLRSENALLYERINEVEQLYESLTLECSKYKDIATLAASQANTLSKRAAQDKGNRERQEDQLRELMAASEDHAIVGELQHQLLQMRATYQQFLVQYDLATETQQQTLLKNQRLELEIEKKAQELSAVREKASDKVQVLETVVGQIKERDWTARNTKWEAFRKRLDALEDEMQVEQQRRKQLEKELEDNQSQLPLLDLRQQRDSQGEITRLKNRVAALETRERLLMGQLDAATKSSGLKGQEERLHAELNDMKTLNQDLMRQLEAIQSRLAELLKLSGGLEAEKREIRCRYEDLQLELQHARAGIGSDGDWRYHDNQRDSTHTSSHSPLMRQKVGLYEKDQAELQQAAQATIASLKQLVEEKNTLIHEYQRKLAVLRASTAQDKAQDRLETTQLNKKLYEDNQRMIGQLKEAMSTISTMERSGKSKQALQAAQERHDHVLQEWKQAEVSLEGAKQSIRELQMERDVLRNERDLAEARAGEALEEIVLMKEQIAAGEKHNQQLEHQVAFAKRDVTKKEEKLKLLRDAIIKLKEEFLKAEDRHAIEIAKAQHAMNQDANTRKRKEKERREEEEVEWREDKTRLESQVQMLQEKLALQKKKLDRQQKSKRKKEEEDEKATASQTGAQALEEELERVKRLLKEKVVSEARAVEELEKKIKILQAQNLALREASTIASATATSATSEKPSREKLEGERKLQRRVDILMLRLKEKQADVASQADELGRCNERITQLQSQLQSQQAKAEKEQAALTSAAAATGSVSAAPSVPMKQQLEELERQNAFLQETLALKRKEWEEGFASQMEKYETQLQRVRRRLAQHGVPLDDGEDESADEKEGGKPQSSLQREEQRFLVGQEVREEILVLGAELRGKEQEMVAKDTKLLELELEVESLRLEYKRLQRKNQRAGAGPSSGSEHEAPRQRRSAKGGGNGARGSAWAVQERLELEEVIENMKKVIEKLRTENEKLKKAAAKQTLVAPERVDALRRKLKEHKEARERLETQVEQQQRDLGELKKDKLRLQQKLRAKTVAPSPSPESNALELQLKEKDQQLLQAEQDLAALRLQLQVERSSHREDDEDTAQEQDERIKELETQVFELEDENTKLTNELAAFDEDFFEEIEDLKYKYAQAVRDKRQLEKRLAGGTGGSSPAPSSSRRSRRS